MSHPHDDSTTDHDHRLLGPRLSRRLAGALVAVAALAAVAIVVQLVLVRPAYQEAQAEQRARADAVRVAEQFTAQVNNYEVDSVDRYQQQVKALLTTKFAEEFDKAMEDIVTSVREAKMTSRGQVLASGVASVDPDSAQVLVVADADVETVFDTRARHFRWEIDLVKVDGKWLVDNFTPVA